MENLRDQLPSDSTCPRGTLLASMTVVLLLLIKCAIQDLWGLPSCVGFIGGSHINLAKVPAKPKGGAASVWTQKSQHGMLLVAVVDHMKRFTYIQYGYSVRSSDMQAQQTSSLYTNPDNFFSPGEYMLGDAGLRCTPTVIAMSRRADGQTDLNENLIFFNSKAAKAHAMVEQAFGILKARFSHLRSASMRMRTERDDMRLILTLNAACILHNLFLGSWKAVVDTDDLQDIMHEEREVRAERLRHKDYSKRFPEQYRRREEVVREMQMIDKRRRTL
ncbi:uncharacterized protein L203_106055 [Cryptococcus depauperatus CBS 7841]|uniref:DDE Tnp4 domain-containing protein n=1 Tax=Cryptococcus depauperatus CBS 7841 TaxID=1295531 RepID=A0AAJ8M4L2_9TREE